MHHLYRYSGLVLAPALLFAGSAQAHHAMDGTTPATAFEGFVSGLAHPVIGLDHLGFLIAAGLVAGVAGLGLAMPVAFVAASLIGVAVHVQEVDIPLAEGVVAASLVAAGALLASGRVAFGRAACLAAFVAAGLFHGYAYGESIVGAEPAPLWSYLAGLAVVQTAVAVGAAAVAARRSWTAGTLAPRLAGASVFGIGLSALAAQVIG